MPFSWYYASTPHTSNSFTTWYSII
jgi:hypothetical protein